MRSVTKYGLSVVTLVFRDDVDIYFARQQVHERVADVERTLPEGWRPRWAPSRRRWARSTNTRWRAPELAAEPDQVAALTRLRTIQDWMVTPLLKGVSGVTEINSFGGYLQQYQILVDPDKLLKYDLSVDAIADAVRKQQLERRRERRLAAVRAVHHPRRGADPVGGRHPQDRAQGRAAARRSRSATSARSASTTRSGRAPPRRTATREVVGGIVMMLRGENSREVVQQRRGAGPRDQRQPRPAGRPADRALLRAVVDRGGQHERPC